MKTFEPTTDRQTQLVEDIKRMFARQKEQAKVIQFSERDQDYFTTNLKVLTDCLKAETKLDLVLNDETGDIQFAEGDKDKKEAMHSTALNHGFKKVGKYSYEHPDGSGIQMNHEHNRYIYHKHGRGTTSYQTGEGHKMLDSHLRQGLIQFAEEGKRTNIVGVLRKHGYSQHHQGNYGEGAYTVWKHPEGHRVMQFHSGLDSARWEHESPTGHVTEGDHHSKLDKHLSKIHK